ncbi:hypothetical protein [Palleronia sp.]|uniref:hypothetical protein n=1 Tax=Palleronia sp. TaxID=1940284 RepID=UPI0035C80861
MNLPIGIMAFIALGATLDSPTTKTKRTVDYAGTALLALLLSTAVILSGREGGELPVDTAGLLAGGALAVAALIGFVLVERRAAEPILPLALFRNPTFLVVSAVGFMVGMAMFGTITFMPLFLQVVKDVNPTASGLFLQPMMGVLLGS